jgi:hypothetical protein
MAIQPAIPQERNNDDATIAHQALQKRFMSVAEVSNSSCHLVMP